MTLVDVGLPADLLAEPFDTIARTFESEDEKKEHVLKLNLARRHMPTHVWGATTKKLLDLRGVQTGQGARNDKATSLSVKEVVENELGVPYDTARYRGSAFKQILELRGVTLGRGARNDRTTSATVAEVAQSDFGVPGRTARHRLAQPTKDAGRSPKDRRKPCKCCAVC